MDYYSVLGINRGASADEIKKAYRQMAMKHHPDRGGDEKKFKEISAAYEMLSDPQKKHMIDAGIDPSHAGNSNNPFEYSFNTNDINDIFESFGFGFGRRPQRPQNKSFSVHATLTLEEVLTGKEISASVGLPGKESRLVNINIPAGVEHGQQIRYGGMGDLSIADAPAGDLIVVISIVKHDRYKREGDHLVYEHTISAWDAMLGTSLRLTTLNNKEIDIKIPAGTQPLTILNCNSEGLPNVRSNHRGNLYIRITVEIPKNLSDEQKAAIINITGNR